MKGKLLKRFSLCCSFFHVYEVSISCLNRTIRVRVYFFIELLNSTVELLNRSLTNWLYSYSIHSSNIFYYLSCHSFWSLLLSNRIKQIELRPLASMHLIFFTCQLENVSDCNVSTVSRHKYPFLFIRRFCFIMKIKHWCLLTVSKPSWT